jgi:indolepyruvate ferredoxin oxidoreductase alpha subunit
VKWIKTVGSYRIGAMVRMLKDAVLAKGKGLRVIIADGECMLARQRREKPITAAKLKSGGRVVRTRFGVDEATCTGDHSCIRLSGCPTLTVKSSRDPLKRDPVAHVEAGCVGCGLCGEVAQAAALCPSFWRADVVVNAGVWERLLDRLRRSLISLMQPA